MNSQTLAHRFFHEPDKNGEYARLNVHFYHNTYRNGDTFWGYYSYSTLIAEIRKDKHGQNVLVISDTTYSSTTSKHLFELRRANPGLPVVDVPRVGNGYYYGYMQGTYDFLSALDTISGYTEQDLRKKTNRERVHHVLHMYDNYVEHFKDMDKESKRIRKSAKLAKVIAMTAQKDEELIARKAKSALIPDEVRAANRAKREAANQRRIERFLNEGDSLEKLSAVFSRNYRPRYHESDMNKALREYRNILNGKRDDKGRWLSYVWISGDKQRVQTSRWCNAPISDVKRLLNLWKHHKSLLGLNAGLYTVVENTPDYVKIGCHVIPTWNIELLCNALNIK